MDTHDLYYYLQNEFKSPKLTINNKTYHKLTNRYLQTISNVMSNSIILNMQYTTPSDNTFEMKAKI